MTCKYMNHDLFQRYVWLVKLLRHTPHLTYDEIAARWAESPLNTDKVSLPLRTFHNHRWAIESLFGIQILCQRKRGNTYALADWDDGLPGSLRVLMLEALAGSPWPGDHASLERRIVLDDAPARESGLLSAVEAIATNHSVSFSHEGKRIMFDPYCLGFIGGQWLMGGLSHDNNRIVTIPVAQTTNMTVLNTEFVYPDDFSPTEFFKNLH